MNKPTPETLVLPRWLRSWEQFWFTPADPSLLALMRITCGAIVVYTLLAYSFKLQDFMGEYAWHDLQLRNEIRRERPVMTGPLNWNDAGALPAPATPWQLEYVRRYREKWGIQPLPPYPSSDEQADLLDKYRAEFGFDLRTNGLPPPENNEQRDYAWVYTQFAKAPPPAYPRDDDEARAVVDYLRRFGADPRRLYSKGMPVFSLWFHITDPEAMAVVHGLIILCAFCFTIGFCTRLTAALTWFGSLCYIHRNTTILFGVDTMMTILLLYLMIGPSSAAFSVDRLIARWWSKAKPGVVQAWCRFWRRPIPAASEIAPATYADVPLPSVAANVVIRLLQIHVCIIYLMAGLSKLLGTAWWNGTAIWMTVGNYEFAPMQYELYLKFLRFLGGHQWLYEAFMTGSGLFTLTFEIGYAFCIWRPRLRWIFLTGAIMLHGGIGLFMGLKTFSMMMLVLNMAFLRKEEVLWLFNKFTKLTGSTAAPATELAKVPVAAAQRAS
jgi:hypothetical protein